eukprot:c40092_g1_i1.p1 GENE.c40092_g1_i1~~c40092_g1_i1.p1  ORF type:complete len:320 (+),score=40.13 c40092_g1_i1:39-998(+)
MKLILLLLCSSVTGLPHRTSHIKHAHNHHVHGDLEEAPTPFANGDNFRAQALREHDQAVAIVLRFTGATPAYDFIEPCVRAVQTVRTFAGAGIVGAQGVYLPDTDTVRVNYEMMNYRNTVSETFDAEVVQAIAKTIVHECTHRRDFAVGFPRNFLHCSDRDLLRATANNPYSRLLTEVQAHRAQAAFQLWAMAQGLEGAGADAYTTAVSDGLTNAETEQYLLLRVGRALVNSRSYCGLVNPRLEAACKLSQDTTSLNQLFGFTYTKVVTETEANQDDDDSSVVVSEVTQTVHYTLNDGSNDKRSACLAFEYLTLLHRFG